ncbi:putative gustatory receptor 77a [Drosophila obscura]|uniref:putative gustatory receptor 77a n=1 Tax=Drosophila obscura TaxID=7282 RepID=UPI001BB144BE|nr:putative gustatory receptor 77a [Drosophila obscura]
MKFNQANSWRNQWSNARMLECANAPLPLPLPLALIRLCVLASVPCHTTQNASCIHNDMSSSSSSLSLSGWTFHWVQRVAIAALLLFYGLTKLFGLMAASTPRRGQRVRQSLYWRIHGYVMLIFVGCFSPFAFASVYHRMAFLRQNRLLLLVGFNRYVLVLVCTFATLYIHTTKQEEIVGCLNQLLRCRRQLKRLMHTPELRQSIDHLSTRGNLLIVGVLIGVYILSPVHTIQILSWDPAVKANFLYAFSLVFIYACNLILRLSLGLYVLALLLLDHLAHHSNELLARILADAASLQPPFGYGIIRWRQQLCRSQQKWLALELWRLLHVHHQLLALFRSICSLSGLQAVCFVGMVPLECMVHMFFSYFMHYSKFILRKYQRPFPVNYHIIFFTMGLVANLVLVICLTHRMSRRFAHTRETLRSGVLALPPAGTVKQLNQTLHYYGLYLKNAEHIFAVSACGLFKLNNVLLFCIVEGMLYYLMILIQFDKVINK